MSEPEHRIYRATVYAEVEIKASAEGVCLKVQHVMGDREDYVMRWEDLEEMRGKLAEDGGR